MPSDRRYNLSRWKTLRSSILFRDNHECQIRLDDACTRVATAVDHIVSPLDGGGFWDPANLRAACKHCNSSRGGTDGHNRRQRNIYTPSRQW